MDKFHEAIEMFKLGSHMSLRYQDKPIVVTYSGGKDSQVLLEVAKSSGEPFEVHHNLTTVDAPPTVQFIKNEFKKLEERGIKCTIEIPMYQGKPLTMWNLIPRKLMPPTRLVRYCCGEFKEKGCGDRVVALGVRWAESTKRSQRSEFETIANRSDQSKKASYEIMLMNDNDDKRKIIEQCRLKGKIACNPIIAMTDADVWDIIHDHKLEYNPLYDNGYMRVGCIGCPMGNKCQKKKQFKDFPTYKRAYIRAFDKMLQVRSEKGLANKWKSGEECFLWWVEDENVEGQLMFDEYMNISENRIDAY